MSNVNFSVILGSQCSPILFLFLIMYLLSYCSQSERNKLVVVVVVVVVAVESNNLADLAKDLPRIIPEIKRVLSEQKMYTECCYRRQKNIY